MTSDASLPSNSDRRIIKRYSNRKLYDTRDSQYVTLQQVADLIRAGKDLQVIDNATKEDKTEATLALIISEELRARPRGIPLATLKELIRHRGERLLTTLRDGAIGKLLPREDGGAGNPSGGASEPVTAEYSSEHADLGQEARTLRAELDRLSDRLHSLERRVRDSGNSE